MNWNQDPIWGDWDPEFQSQFRLQRFLPIETKTRSEGIETSTNTPTLYCSIIETKTRSEGIETVQVYFLLLFLFLILKPRPDLRGLRQVFSIAGMITRIIETKTRSEGIETTE